MHSSMFLSETANNSPEVCITVATFACTYTLYFRNMILDRFSSNMVWNKWADVESGRAGGAGRVSTSLGRVPIQVVFHISPSTRASPHLRTPV